MKLLLDTQMSIWSVARSTFLSSSAKRLLDDPANELLFSTVCIWEVSIKYALRKTGFDVEPRLLRRALLDRGDTELLITSEHAIAVASLPLIHRDPFDRLLVSQAMTEGLTLITSDSTLAAYGPPVQVVDKA